MTFLYPYCALALSGQAANSASVKVVEGIDYLLGSMMARDRWTTIPGSRTDGFCLERSLAFWRGAMDQAGYVAMIDVDEQGEIPAHRTPTLDYGRNLPVSYSQIFAEALVATGKLGVEHCDRLEALAHRGRIATTGRLAQAVAVLLYPDDATCVSDRRKHVIEELKTWALPAREKMMQHTI